MVIDAALIVLAASSHCLGRGFARVRDDDARGTQGFDRFVRGSLLDDAGADQRPDSVGRGRGPDHLRGSDRLGSFGFGGEGQEHGLGFGGLRHFDHMSRLLHRGDLGTDQQPDLLREEALAHQRPPSRSDRVEEWLRPAVLDEQERESRPGREGRCQCPCVSRIEPRRVVPDEVNAAKRNDARQECAEVLIVTYDQPLDHAVLALRDEQHVEQSQHPSALEPIDFSQDPTLEVRTGTKADRDHLQRTRHPTTSPSLPAPDCPSGSATSNPDGLAGRRGRTARAQSSPAAASTGRASGVVGGEALEVDHAVVVDRDDAHERPEAGDTGYNDGPRHDSHAWRASRSSDQFGPGQPLMFTYRPLRMRSAVGSASTPVQNACHCSSPAVASEYAP